ncbi:MAG TPA: EAL domain-containing protein [Candidatus Brocadiaceae bacterium]|nr:EAL domain-containing protein [Candidatus Brocadiaceae bacterium]
MNTGKSRSVRKGSSSKKRMEEELKAFAETLENRVRERTLALEGANQKLQRINEELSKLSAAVEQSVNLIYITDVKGQIEYVNATFEKIAGYSRVEAIGQNTRILQSGETSQPVYEELWNTILAGETWKGSFKNKKKNGQYYYCESIIIPMRDEKGQITSFLCVQEDVTEKLELKKDASLAASYASFDGLTGLYNRTRFMELLEEWLFQAKQHKYEGALLLIDIDRFRQINDTYGNKTGDDLLKRIADFLKDGIDETDMQFFLKASDREVMESLLCRMGGDEFAIFLPSRTEQEAVATADEIRKKLESFQFGDWTGHITISVGIAIYPLHGSTLYDILKKADAAVFSSKELGRNRVRLYHPDDMVLEQMHSRLEGKGRIMKAISDNRFETWFQPILELKNDTISHYETLVRMRNEDMSIVQPGEFINIAESLGLIMDIDRIIIEKTLRFRQNLLKQGKDLHFSMNLSAKDMNDQEFRLFLMETMMAAKEGAGRLIFEITETVAIHDLDRAVKFIRELKTTGCKFSLDDFGVGFTSFKYLQEMDLDYIKIDGAFIKKLPDSRNDRLFVKAMVDVAHGLGIQTVAEFVENELTIRVLRELGVDYAQGYFIGKPAPDVL